MGELHASGIVHGAISPSNLVIDANGKIRITGYSIPEIRTEKTSMESEIFEGYAAVEQYGMSGGISPATDIYGFAAVLYRALIGSTPIGAASRLANDKLMIPGKFAEQLPAYVINALVNALQILPEDRTQSFEELRDEMSASPTAQALSSNYDLNEDVSDEPLPLLDDEEDYEYEEAYDSQKPDKKKNVVKIALISAAVSLAVLLLVVLGIKLVSGDNNSDVPTTEESTTGEYQDDYQDNKSITLPDFTGKVYEDVKNNKEYDGLLVFEMETVDSELERGTIISQSINPGTLIMEERHIVLKVSNGLSVPADNLLLGKDVDDIVSELKSIGFKNVRKESTKKATAAYLSNQVFSVVYENSETGKWAELPSDRRLSSGDTIIVYYYSKYEEPTTEPESTEQETIPVEPETDDMTVAEGQDTEEVYE